MQQESDTQDEPGLELGDSPQGGGILAAFCDELDRCDTLDEVKEVNNRFAADLNTLSDGDKALARARREERKAAIGSGA